MRIRIRGAAFLALALATAACSDRGAVTPELQKFDGVPQALVNESANGVRISEIHYDNDGADAGEAVEISAPATTDLAGWSVHFINGATTSGLSYGSRMVPIINHTVCGDRKVAVVTFSGIQNGAPDGIALVDPNGVLVEFLSYEGSFVGRGAPVLNVSSTDIGVAQLEEPVGHTLQRTSSANTWVASPPGAPGKFRECNDNGTPPPEDPVASIIVTPATATVDQGGTAQFVAQALNEAGNPINNITFEWSSSAEFIATVSQTGVATGVHAGETAIMATAPNGVVGQATLTVNEPPPPPEMPAVRFSEIHYDNFGTDVGEAIEIEGPAGTDLSGWSIQLYNGSSGRVYNTRMLSGVIAATCTMVANRGIVYFEYPTDGIQNGSPDAMALVNAAGEVVEFLSYEGVVRATDGPALGTTSKDIGVAQTSAPLVQTLQRNNDGTWSGPVSSTIGGCNSGGPISRANIISFGGRLQSDPALPVGFEDQLFATLVNPSTGAEIETTFTWTSEANDVASIDADGVMRALSAGTAMLRATAADGTSSTYSLPTRIPTAGSAQYGNHIEFGTPSDGDNSNDLIITRAQYVTSFNINKGIPNWAAYNLDQTHFGGEDRCDCFTYDPELPIDKRYTTADYTGAGTFHGYGIDRGHLVRSFDREAGSLDNATTFYFSNIVPQAADNNQGPWAAFENFLGAFAQSGSNEVYIIAGASGSKGTVKNEGIITIPSAMWKVAIVMPRNQGLSNVDSYDDVQVFAVIMPNEPGIRNTDWHLFQVKVDDVEALSGYDVFALLPDHIELALETGTRPPVGVTNGPYTLNEGGTASLSALGSADADGHALTYAWSFGDGETASGTAVTHTYAQDGNYSVRLIVTDILGLADTVFTTANVANIAPDIAVFAGATLLPGETYSISSMFTDPGADIWTATVNYGDGSGTNALGLSGQTFTLMHTFISAGTFTVTVTVHDDDVSTTRTETVTVLSIDQALQEAGALVEALVAPGKLNPGNANSLQVKLDSAARQLEAGNNTPAGNQLEALLKELDAMVRSNRLSDADVSALRSLITRVIRSIAT